MNPTASPPTRRTESPPPGTAEAKGRASSRDDEVGNGADGTRERPGAGTLESRGRGSLGRRDRDRRILPIALFASALLHVIAIVVIRAGGDDDPGGLPALARRPAALPAGLEVVPIRPVPDAVAPQPAAPEPTPTGAQPRRTTRTQPSPPQTPQPDADERAFSAAVEALRPRYYDPRLFGTDAADLRTAEERAALRAYARLRQWNDSTAMEAERARRATDWTYTDAQGRRWGFSPGKIHLGNLELPLPVAFSPPPGQRDLIRSRVLEWEAIQAQAARAEIDEEFNERVRAIRERMDAERE